MMLTTMTCLYFSLFSSVIVILTIFKIKSLYNWIRTNYFLSAIGIFLITRVALFIVLYYLIGYGGPGDLRNYWFPWGQSILNGEIPYLDFWLDHSVLLPYLLAVPLIFQNKATSIVLSFILVDALTTLFTFLLAKEIYNKEIAFNSILLYLLSPISWYFIVPFAQEESIIALFLLISLYLWIKGREKISMLSLGLMFSVTKCLTAIFFIPFVIYFRNIKIKNKLVNFSILLSTIFLIYLPFVLAGADIFQPFHAAMGTSILGVNLWALLMVLGYNAGSESFIILFISLLVTTIFLYRISNKNKEYILYAPLFIALIFLVFSKRSFIFYVLQILPLISIFIASRLERRFFLWSFIIYGFFGALKYDAYWAINRYHISFMHPQNYPREYFLFALFIGLILFIIQLLWIKELYSSFKRIAKGRLYKNK